MTSSNPLLIKDFNNALYYFPKLRIVEIQGNNEIIGQIEIYDIDCRYWNSYSIRILVPPQYPYGVPDLFETSGKIPHCEYRHKSIHGLCCIAMEHELILLSRNGLSILTYLRDFVYPFLSNQTYFDFKNDFANGEYNHEHIGVQEYYQRKLKLPDPRVNLLIIRELIIENMGFNNNKKTKRTGNRPKYIRKLQNVGPTRLIEDYHSFKKIICPNYSSISYFLKKSKESPIHRIFILNYLHSTLEINPLLLGNTKLG